MPGEMTAAAMTAAAMTAAVAAKGSLLTVARSRVRRRTKKKTADEPSGATDSRRNTVGTDTAVPPRSGSRRTR